jgi:cardiolipin synthase
VFVESAWLGLVPWWLTAAVVARDVMIGLGALVFRLWFGPLRGRPTILSKINTALQLLYVMLVVLNAASGVPPHEILDAAAALVIASTVLSGLHYVASFTRRVWTPARPA